MGARHVRMLEAGAGCAAAASLAVAFGYATAGLGSPAVGAAAAALAALVTVHWMLRSIADAQPTFAMAQFELAPMPEADWIDELVLTEADRLDKAGSDELLLEDVLTELGDSARVVRLFDPSAMPTPGEMKSRIDRHLRGSPLAPTDASQALYDALSQLRRSLR